MAQDGSVLVRCLQVGFLRRAGGELVGSFQIILAFSGDVMLMSFALIRHLSSEMAGGNLVNSWLWLNEYPATRLRLAMLEMAKTHPSYGQLSSELLSFLESGGLRGELSEDLLDEVRACSTLLSRWRPDRREIRFSKTVFVEGAGVGLRDVRECVTTKTKRR